jgi:hypothetical protein
MPSQIQNDEFVDVKGAAEILKISPSFLNKARVYGDGPPFVKIGKAVRYRVSGLFSWADAQVRRSTSDTVAA